MQQIRGTRQGDTMAPTWFNECYHKPLTEWQRKMKEWQPVDDLLVEWEGATYKVDTTVYADDLTQLVMADTIAGFKRWAERAIPELEDAMGEWDLRMHPSKTEAMCRVFGMGSRGQMQRAYKPGDAGKLWPGETKPAVRLLGGRLAVSGAMEAEIRARIAAARFGQAKFSKVFKCRGARLRDKVLIWKCVVLGSLLSSLEVRTLSGKQVARLDRVMVQLGRRALGSASWLQRENRRATTEEVRQKLKVDRMDVILQERRAHYFQRLCQRDDKQVLAVLLGKFRWEQEGPLTNGVPNQWATPWVKQIWSDLRELVPGFEGFVGGWQDHVADAGVLTKSKSREPRVGGEEDARIGDTHDEAHEAQPAGAERFKCRHPNCGVEWDTKRQRACHEWAKHGIANARRTEVLKPVCPDCGRRFTTVTAARLNRQKTSCGKKVTNPLAELG